MMCVLVFVGGIRIACADSFFWGIVFIVVALASFLWRKRFAALSNGLSPRWIPDWWNLMWIVAIGTVLGVVGVILLVRAFVESC
jgi:hypothetical protein